MKEPPLQSILKFQVVSGRAEPGESLNGYSVLSIVTAGGLSLDGTRWIDTEHEFLFPFAVLSKIGFYSYLY
jgi:hypothetical protein